MSTWSVLCNSTLFCVWFGACFGSLFCCIEPHRRVAQGSVDKTIQVAYGSLQCSFHYVYVAIAGTVIALFVRQWILTGFFASVSFFDACRYWKEIQCPRKLSMLFSATDVESLCVEQVFCTGSTGCVVPFVFEDVLSESIANQAPSPKRKIF